MQIPNSSRTRRPGCTQGKGRDMCVVGVLLHYTGSRSMWKWGDAPNVVEPRVGGRPRRGRKTACKRMKRFAGIQALTAVGSCSRQWWCVRAEVASRARGGTDKWVAQKTMMTSSSRCSRGAGPRIRSAACKRLVVQRK